MSEAQMLTHSRLSCFRACPRRHYMRYELGLRPEKVGYAARVGSAFHLALDALATGQDVEAAMQEATADPYDLAMVAAMVVGHQRRWEGDELTVVASELEFDLPLRNPETGAPTPIWRLAGVIDRIVQLDDGRLAVKEAKTTSRDFSPGSDYWTRLHMDQQLSIYVIAARRLGYDVSTILYDVTRRPGLRPLKATPEDQRKYRKSDGKLYANQRAEDETPEEFAARVSEDIASRPEHYFCRMEIARLDDDLDECRRELWQQQQGIRQSQRDGHWWRNPGACFSPYPCRYLPICKNRDLETTTPPGFERTERVHPELESDESPPSEGKLAHATTAGQTAAQPKE